MERPSASSASPIDPRLAEQIVQGAIDYAIFTLDFEGRVASWSSGAERILGYSADEAIGMDFAVLFLEPDRAADRPAEELTRAIHDGRAEDTRWHVRKDGQTFWANGVTMRLAGAPTLVKVMRDETSAKLAEDQRVLLLNELNHRIKNTLATVQSIVEQTLRTAGVDAATRETLTDRLMALSEAHNVLVAESWAGADLEAVLRRALSPHQRTDGSPFELEGPPVRLSPQQAVSMSLVVHELATNALKYGALSVPSGRVAVTWNLGYDERGARRLVLLWREAGGPAVQPPARRGFGSRLIERSFDPSRDGQTRLLYEPDGLQCVLELLLSGSEELPILEVRGDPAAGAASTTSRRPA
ncbi:sensor histidine kinase [Phenylobacterium sp. VNQ135]|uniref:sensor histidine kinase n=1 Tax=Phenylobacterium sp. VNQ135 TaxID=3400922 RepID=UPI003C0C021A